MENRIKVTSKRLPKIVVTNSKLERIDPAAVAEVLEAEPLKSNGSGVIPKEDRVPKKGASVKGSH